MTSIAQRVALVLAGVVGAGCAPTAAHSTENCPQTGIRPRSDSSNDVPPAESPPPAEMQEVRDVASTLTQDDLESIREALAAGIGSSDDEEFRSLTGNTGTAPCMLGEDGGARIGLWVLWKFDGPGLRFVWRRAGTYGPAFMAEVEKGADGWVLISLDSLHISPVPP